MNLSRRSEPFQGSIFTDQVTTGCAEKRGDAAELLCRCIRMPQRRIALRVKVGVLAHVRRKVGSENMLCSGLRRGITEV